MTTTDGIKLSIQAHGKDKTYIHNVEIDNWEQLNIFHIKVNPNTMSQQMYHEMLDALNQHAMANKLKEPVILVGDEFEIAAYRIAPEPPKAAFEQLVLELEPWL